MDSLPLRKMKWFTLGMAMMCVSPCLGSTFAQLATGPVRFLTAAGMTATYKGFGVNTGGEGGETYTVTSLANSGAGTLRNGVTLRNYNGSNLIPRKIVFAVCGDITLTSTLEINLGFLTIDGSTAPAPGITIRKSSPALQTFLHNASNVVITYLRFVGNNAGVGGYNLSLQGSQHIVVDHITSSNADDTGIGIIGGNFDITVSWCLIYDNPKAMLLSYGPNGRISIHRNVMVNNAGSVPEMRYENQTVDFVNNIVSHWITAGSTMEINKVEAGAGYGDGATDANIINNAFAPYSVLIYGDNYGTLDDGGPEFWYQQGYVWTNTEGSLMGQLYVSGNRLLWENLDHYSTVNQMLPIPSNAQVSAYDSDELGITVVPYVGTVYPLVQERAPLNLLYVELGGSVPSDVNLDGQLDQWDVDFMRDCRTGASVPQTDPDCATADLDQDGDVDQSDFGALQLCLYNSDYLSLRDQGEPVIAQGQIITLMVNENTSTTFQLTATSGQSAPNLNWQINSPPQSGFAAIVSGSPSIAGIPVTLSYNPATNYLGDDAFVVEVNNGPDLVDSITVNVIVLEPGAGRVFYVATTGDDTNVGTLTSPFRTIQTAAAAVQPGDTVYVRGGTYDTASYPSPDSEATSVLFASRDGTPTSPIRFEAYQNEAVILDGRSINSNAILIQSSYVTVAKMTAVNCKRAGGRIYASYRAIGSVQPTSGPPVFTGTPTGRRVIGSHIVECIAHNCSALPTGFFPGFQMVGQCDNCSIEYSVSYANGAGFTMIEESSVNTFRTWPQYSTWPDSPTNCTLLGCVAYGNLKEPEHSDGIGGRYMTGCTIQNCISYNNVDDNIDTVASSNCVFDGNITFNGNPTGTVDGDGNGFKLGTREGGGNIVRNNISFLNPRAGFDNDDGKNDIYHNNVAYKNESGFFIECDKGSNGFLNNVSYLNINDDVTMSQDCPNAPPFQPIVSDYNYWGDAGPPYNPCTNAVYEGTHSKAFGANSKGLAVAGDPRFVSPVTNVSQVDTSGITSVQPGGIQAAVTTFLAQIRGKFALQAGSPCINAGTNAAAYYATPGTTPFNGTAPDMGAVETP